MIGLIMAPWHFAQSQTGESGAPSTQFALSELVVTAGGKAHTFRIEVAITDQQRRQGLMHRTSLDSDSGMLFDYGTSRPVAMWMKNTLIPLDMLFIAENGKIVNIAHDTEPLSLATIGSAGPVRAVLELNAGTARRLGIGSGDSVVYGIFKR
ncbi:MAG: DUF192 domain-containing protein [Rhodospirillaceae bacterium]|nr:DUF192 domain-containing protein [Rhodospirillaceae bacterium]